MNYLIKKAKKEYDEGNFDNVLEILNDVEFDEYTEKLGNILRFSSLMELKRYAESLEIINLLIEEDAYNELLWMEKVRCHYLLDDDSAALKSLGELERIVNSNDVDGLVNIASFYNLIGNDDKVIEFCNRALAVDGASKKALFEKAHVAIRRKDYEMLGEISDRLLDVSGDDLLFLTAVFILKLFSNDYRGAVSIIDGNDCFDGELNELLKSIIFKQISDDLNVEIILTEKIQISIDTAVDLLIKYHEEGIDSGEIDGVYYLVA